MFFTSKPAYAVKLQNGESVEQVLIALAMASYEAAESFFEDGLSPDGQRATGMLNPDSAAKYVKDDELLMCYVQGKFCMTHIRRVRHHLSQIEKDDTLTFEVLSYEGDLDKLFERADTILGWGVIAPSEEIVTATVATSVPPQPMFDLDAEIDIAIDDIAPMGPLVSVPADKPASVRPVAA